MQLFRRILVPHDFSAHATRALGVAADLARLHRGRLIVLHVVTPFHPVTGFPEDGTVVVPELDVLTGERDRLEALVRRTLGRVKVPVECRVTIGDPFHRIVDAARHADAIVMATAGRTGLSRLVIGSVAEKVVRHARVPVLTVRPAPARAASRRARR
ncbi:MAG TPA: universal stress protein [Candidatus Binatia bacterium]|nr:universal stress protein [Candidatus Binatia bacterium]